MFKFIIGLFFKNTISLCYDWGMISEISWLGGMAWLVLLFIFGAILGSFACCQVWRMRYLETGKGKLGPRSVCLACGERLKWFDNIPIVSWLLLRGKCRKCGEKIGWAEFWSEIGLAVLFVLIGCYFRPWQGEALKILLMIVMLVSVVVMWMILIYDAKWQKIPVVCLVLVNSLALVFWGTREVIKLAVWGESDWWEVMRPDLWNTLISVGILAGIYLVLYKVSKEKWVGGGDWILGLAIGLMLGNWWMALLTLFLANLLALGFMLPDLISRQKKMIALGPFLVIGFLISFLLQDILMALI